MIIVSDVYVYTRMSGTSQLSSRSDHWILFSANKEQPTDATTPSHFMSKSSFLWSVPRAGFTQYLRGVSVSGTGSRMFEQDSSMAGSNNGGKDTTHEHRQKLEKLNEQKQGIIELERQSALSYFNLPISLVPTKTCTFLFV